LKRQLLKITASTRGEKLNFLLARFAGLSRLSMIAQVAIDCSGIANDCFDCNQLFPLWQFFSKVSAQIDITQKANRTIFVIY